MKVQQLGCIYRLRNTINGKKYIGKSINFKHRMICHKNSEDGCYIHNAIQKYGWEKFKVEKIIDNVPEEDLNNLEMAYIAAENTKRPNGYNLTDGGEGTSGYVPSEATRKKMSESRKRLLSNRDRFGCVFFNNECKQWQVCSARPQSKYIGRYLTKEKGIEALNHYNLTGEFMPSAGPYRKRGTGNINKTHSGRYRARYTKNKKLFHKLFDTPEQCKEWLKSELNY